ncbi:hypothetical protein [Streptomyces sp. NBC_00829]|uniref:hypothetical protein n=1 Tax=Streptomyces sp. NBC_00829 TaxID=2903679 RepID=UPI0038657594|nr:hypothetical protein OG293_20545 [Streptomyces sp. NBC_00829]
MTRQRLPRLGGKTAAKYQGLRANGVRPAAVAGELGLTVDEMNKMLFGLTITMVEGGGEQTEREPRRALSLVN